jgi:hypothetical protein
LRQPKPRNRHRQMPAARGRIQSIGSREGEANPGLSCPSHRVLPSEPIPGTEPN